MLFTDTDDELLDEDEDEEGEDEDGDGWTDVAVSDDDRKDGAGA